MAQSPGLQEDRHSTTSIEAFIYYILAGIALTSTVLLIIIWLIGAKYNTLAYEAAKVCMQVLGVVLVGFVVSYASFTLQHNREQRESESDQAREKLQHESDQAREKLQRESDQAREDLQREIERKREDWRREVEQARDARRRKDELLHSTLNETLSAYNTVKSTRRILRARIWAQAAGSRVDADVYDQQLALINDMQLQFEELKRTAPLVEDVRVDKKKLEQSFERIEKYLGKLVIEYESERRKAAHIQGGASVSDMTELQTFLDSEYKGPFMTGIAIPIHDILNDLRTALLEPLELPVPAANE